MSELQIGVLILGGSIIGLVYGFNVFQEWRFRKRTRQAFIRPQNDVLLTVPKNNVREGVKSNRLEPVVGDGGIPVLDQEDDICGVILPLRRPGVTANAKDELGSDQPLPEKPNVVAQPGTQDPDPRQPQDTPLDAHEQQVLVTALLDPSLDFIAEITCAAVVELTAVPCFNVSKRVQIIGRTEEGVWLSAEVLPIRYKQMSVALQLVDRSGAVTEQELVSFCQQVTRFAEEHHAAVSFPLRQQKLVAARELDRFCSGVDVLIGVNIVASTPIEGTRLQRYAETAGLQLEGDGAFHYLAESGHTLYSLIAENQMPFTLTTLQEENFPALTLLFDVPRVAAGVEAFERALAFARQLAEEFEAELVDDNRRALTDAGLSKICDRLRRIYRSMDERGIAPGSVAALRLFA